VIKTLLLNYNYQIIAFIDEKRAIRLLFKNKAEVISNWIGRKINSINGFIEHPATLKMKYLVNLRPTKLTFSRKLVLRRDEYTCCYCNKKYKYNNLTIDHIIPKSCGGENSFINCVTACIPCNMKKRNRTPEQAGMVLKIKPKIPDKFLCYFPGDAEWHDDWLFFISN